MPPSELCFSGGRRLGSRSTSSYGFATLPVRPFPDGGEALPIRHSGLQSPTAEGWVVGTQLQWERTWLNMGKLGFWRGDGNKSRWR